MTGDGVRKGKEKDRGREWNGKERKNGSGRTIIVGN